MKRIFRLLFVFLLAVAFVSIDLMPALASSSTSVPVAGSNAGNVKDTIVMGMSTSPTGIFNPLLADTKYDDAVDALVYTSLQTVNDKGELENYIIDDMKISEDNLKISYTLKENLKWHDGTPLTAKDVAYTFTVMCAPDFKGGHSKDAMNIKGAKAYNKGEAKEIEGIKVSDDRHLEIEFEAPTASSLTELNITGIIPEHIWSKVPAGEWDSHPELLQKPVGSGPYKVTEFTQGQMVKFEAFDGFALGTPATKNIIFKIINADTISAETANKTVDIVDVSDLMKAELDTMEGTGYKIVSFPNFMYQYTGFNMREPLLQDKNLRKAFMYAINRKGMVESLLEGRGQIVNVPMLPSGWAYPEESTLEQYDYNPDKAKEILASAGYKDSDNDGILESLKGEKLSIELICPLGSKKREQAALVIQQNLKDIGVEININNMEFSAVMEKVVANHEYFMYMMGNTLSLDPDPTPFWHSDAIGRNKGDQGYNIVAYENKDLDALIEKGNSIFDQNERKKIYADYAKILNDEVPQIYLYCQNIEYAYISELTDFTPSTFNTFYNVHRWSIPQ